MFGALKALQVDSRPDHFSQVLAEWLVLRDAYPLPFQVHKTNPELDPKPDLSGLPSGHLK